MAKPEPSRHERPHLHQLGNGLARVVLGQTPHGSRSETPVSDTQLEREISQIDERTAQYGGDDPNPPNLDDTDENDSDTPTDRQTLRVPESDGQGHIKARTHHPKPSEQETDPNQVGWDGPNDPENPQNWTHRRRWFLTLLVSLLTINVTFASSAPSTATREIAKHFDISVEVATLVTSLFLVGYMAGPILWSTGSELYGRKAIFSTTMVIYALFTLGQVLAQNPETLFITRFLAGVFSSAPLTNAGGVIADLWGPVERGYAMSLFSASVFLGPVMGPIIGGFVTSALGWRWVFWIIFFFAMACWVLALLFLPETFAPVLLVRKAQRYRRKDPEKNKDLYAPHEKADWSFRGVIRRTIFRPFIILALEPILVLITIYLSIVYGLLYGLFEAFPIIWEEMRGFNGGEGGLIFIGVGIGTSLGAMLNVVLQRKYTYLTPLWKGHPPPEERLSGSMAAGPLLVIGIFFLGWTGAYASVPWYVPAISTIFIGMSFTLVFISFLTYIVDSYLMYSASALAANTIVRSALGAGFPLFTSQMFHSLGVQWACTLLGCIGILLAPSPFLFYIYGSRIREKSKFAPAIDLKIRKELEREGVLPESGMKMFGRRSRSGLEEAAKRVKEEREGVNV